MQKDKFGDHIARILAENERRRREIPADFYSVVHPPNLFMTTQRNRSLLRLLRREGITTLSERRILEVGCGSANWLLDLLSWGANPELLCGIDIDQHQLAEAGRKLPAADLRLGNAADLPWPDAFFDIVLQATLFTSILDDDFRRAVAAEMIRVAKPGGLILWYDLRFNNPRNPHVRAIAAKEVKELFPGCYLRLQRVTLLPPLARWIVPLSWGAALLLERVPFLRTHLLGCIRPPRAAPAAFGRKARPASTGAAVMTTAQADGARIRYSHMYRSLAREVSELHALCFRDFFLTGLGRGILALYYSHYHGRADSICFVASSASGELIGFVAGSRNYGEFLRSFYRAHFLKLAMATVRALLFNPDLREKIRLRTPHMKAAIKSLFQAHDSPERGCSSGELAPLQTAGLASVAVHPDFRGKGVAVELFRLFEQRAKSLGVRRAELSVFRSNARAIAFYRKVGWRIASRDERYIIFEKML